MRLLRLSCLVLALTTPIAGIPQSSEPDSASFCKPDGPALTDEAGREIWLSTDELLKGATHCEPPQMPALWRQSRIEGYVAVDILVDEKGKVVCVRLVSGHPMLAGSAIDAAKAWVFRPRRKDGKALSFYGRLRFHFSTGDIPKGETRCTVARQ
jgi:TonB family protein